MQWYIFARGRRLQSLFACIDVVLASAASEQVEDGADSEAAADDPARDNIELSEGERGAEDVEEGLDPERVDEGAVLVYHGELEDDSEEEECEEAVVAFDDNGVQFEISFRDGFDREGDGQHAESNYYSQTTPLTT